MTPIPPINDLKKMIMEYTPQQWGILATADRKWRVLAEEDGMKLWEQIAQIPNIVFIAKHSAAIKNATTAKGKMKALGDILYHTTWARLPRGDLRDLGDHSVLLERFRKLSDAMRSEQLLSTAISKRDFTLFKAINLKMFPPESIDLVLEPDLSRMEYLEKLIPHASEEGLSRALATAVEKDMQDAAKQILKSKKGFSVDRALVAAARHHATYIPPISESGKPFSVKYDPLRSFGIERLCSGLQAALFEGVEANKMDGIDALLRHFKTFLSLEMLKHARDHARLVHIYHEVNDNPPFANRARQVLNTLHQQFDDGTQEQRQAIFASLPQRYREARSTLAQDGLEDLVFRLSAEDHDLRPMIERLNREIATRFPGEPPEPQPTLAQYQPDPVDRSDGHLGRMMGLFFMTGLLFQYLKSPRSY